MKKKTIFIILFIVTVCIIFYYIINHISISKNDAYFNYTPEQEISDSHSKETTLNLYFLNTENNELKSEARSINTGELLKNPYKTIVEKLLQGPDNPTFKKIFPENTKILDASLSGDCVILNFSEELLNFKDDVEKYNIINSLLNSLTQLNEVSAIKILVNNELNDKISQEYTSIL